MLRQEYSQEHRPKLCWLGGRNASNLPGLPEGTSLTQSNILSIRALQLLHPTGVRAG